MKITETTREFKLIYELHQLVAVEVDGQSTDFAATPEFDSADWYIYSESAAPTDWKRILFGNYSVTYRPYQKFERYGETLRIKIEEPRLIGSKRGIIGMLL